MKNLLKKKKCAVALLVALGVATPSGYAATVPQNIKLATIQNLVKSNGAEPASLDPHKIEGDVESNITTDLFEGLTQHDPQGHIIPGVATHWQSNDNKLWVFQLRNNAKWSDGSPVTAQDFVYSWRRIVDPKTASPYASYLQDAHLLNAAEIISGKKDKSMLGVKALDDHTLQVTLSEPVSYFPAMTAHYAMQPVNHTVVEKYGDKWTLPQHYVSNGAYTLKDWVVNERIVLVRNPHYWDNAHTLINQVTFLPISGVADVNRYQAGEVDITSGIPLELFHHLKTETPQQVHVAPILCTGYYEMNNQRPPLNDVRVREALKLGLDRDIIVHKVLNQGQREAFSFTPPYTHGIALKPPAWFTWTQQQRNQLAKKLLAEAGYGPTHPLRLQLLYNTNEQNKKVAIAAAAIWKKNIGIDVQLRNQEWKTFLDARHQGNFELARAGWCADYNEPSSFLNIMLSDSSNNTAHYRSDAFDHIMAQALRTTNEVGRAAIYQRAEQQLDQDSVTIPIWYAVNARLVKPFVGGYSGQDPLNYVYDKNLYIRAH
ncbi:ABC transporter substrate-binding protein [Edwardsiella tarda]|uniref:ABC transporter substrate-binding protein n=1 Tax=Edwardsiella tarda TaxID=636 RepID=UPI003B502160